MHNSYYTNTYSYFSNQVLAQIRNEVYGKDIGQNSWTTADEYNTFAKQLALNPHLHLLEVACGSGGPALHLARQYGYHVMGVDINEAGITTANQTARSRGILHATFQHVDADAPLPFPDKSFDAILCVDSLNHLRNRLATFTDWHRLLPQGRRILFTDPVVLTGAVSNEELAARSSIGFFLFVPLEVTKQYLQAAGFNLIHCEDLTENMALISSRRVASREKYREALIRIEGRERFEAAQHFNTTVHKLASERRLSRFVFTAEAL